MAALNPETHRKSAKQQEEIIRRFRERAILKEAKEISKIKMVFGSPEWYYPVHKYIGDIVRDNEFSVDYQPEYKQICFKLYCAMFSNFLQYLSDYKTIAAAVIIALPSKENPIQKRLLPEEYALISEKDAIYILGAYDFECFDFLLRTFAIEMKDDCLYYVKEQLEKLTKTKPAIANLEQVKKFYSNQSNKLVEQKREAVKGIERICANQFLSGIKHTTPTSFIILDKIDPEKMPSVPRDPNPKLWEKYFVEVCRERLTLTLEKEKNQWKMGYSDCSNLHAHKSLHARMDLKFTYLQQMLSKEDLSPEALSSPPIMLYFREEINRLTLQILD